MIMGVLATITGLLALATVCFITSLAAAFAIASSLFGLLAAIGLYRPELGRLMESFWSKVLFGFVALTSFAVIEPFAEDLVGRMTLLNPSLFPDSVKLFAILWTGFALFALVYLVVLIWTIVRLMGDKENPCKNPAAVGCFFGAVATCLLFLPSLGRGLSMSYFVLEHMSFTKNGRPYVVYSSDYDELPVECMRAAAGAQPAVGDRYECAYQPFHCGNIPGSSMIAFLPDDQVAVMNTFKESEGFRIVLHLRFDLEPCDRQKRYEVRILEHGTTPHLGTSWRIANW